jgi:hypothetical protein
MDTNTPFFEALKKAKLALGEAAELTEDEREFDAAVTVMNLLVRVEKKLIAGGTK